MAVSVLLIAVVALSLVLPTQAGSPDTLSVESTGSHSITVNFNNNFDMEFWIRDPSHQIVDLKFTISWDPNKMEAVSGVTSPPSGWGMGTKDLGPGLIQVLTGGATPFQGDKLLFTLSFRCIDNGISTISVIDASYHDPPGVPYNLNILSATANQQRPVVGGVVSPVNKPLMLAPYLALVGLVAAVSAVVVIRRHEA
jgi:hypothetical protein